MYYHLLSWNRVATAATIAVLFLSLAYIGYQGRQFARRQADFDLILELSSQVQQALNAQRSRFGPTSGRFDPNAGPSSEVAQQPEVTALRSQIADFYAAQAPVLESELVDLRLGEVMLAIAERRFTDALDSLKVLDGQVVSEDSDMRDRSRDALRLRADANYDAHHWPTALDDYRLLLRGQADDLTSLERVADCLYAMNQFANAGDAYADLAQRLQDRGDRLMTQMDHNGASRDFAAAVRVRLWLIENGKRDLEPALAKSFTSCGDALVELRKYDLAEPYFVNAINLKTKLLSNPAYVSVELAGELADNHSKYADLLQEVNKPLDAMTQLSTAIDILSRLYGRGRPEYGGQLATSLAHRGLTRQSQGQIALAAQDLQQAAEVLAATNEFQAAVKWQSLAVSLVDAESKSEAQARLDHYLAGKVYPDSTAGDTPP